MQRQNVGEGIPLGQYMIKKETILMRAPNLVCNRIKNLLCLIPPLLIIASTTLAQSEGATNSLRWSINGYLGAMTTNKADELVNPEELEFDSNNLAGFALAYDRTINISRFSLGFELQVTRHFGSQEYYEIGVPITIRYRPENPWLEMIESFAFGLGGSHTTEVPQVEIDTNDGSRRNLIYWMLETEFQTRTPGDTWFFRIHHRSDAWGLLEPEGGSNAMALGFRRVF